MMDGRSPEEHHGQTRVPGQHAVTDMSPKAKDEADGLQLGQLLGILWQGKLWIALCMTLGLLGAVFSYANTRPIFQADALLQLEEKSGALAVPGNLTNLLENDARTTTEVEILRSRMVLGQAVADLNLDWRIAPAEMPVIGTMVARYRLPFVDWMIPDHIVRVGETLIIEDFTVPPRWVNRGFLLRSGEQGMFSLTLPDGTILEGQAGSALALPEDGFSLTIGNLRMPPGREFALRQVDEDAAIRTLRNRISVRERGRGSRILEIRITGPNLRENIRVLNAVIGAYQRQNISRSAAQAEGSLIFIREQLPLAERNLREAESALNTFRQQQISVDFTLETQSILGQLTRVEAELSDLRRREDEIALRYTPSHPTYRLLLDERGRLEERQETLRAQVGTLPETQQQIVNLTRNVELAQRLHLELLTRAQQVEVLRASTIGNVRIIDPAVSAAGSITTPLSQLLAIGLSAGLALGATMVLVRGWFRRRVQSLADVEKLGLPVFATINYSPLADTKGRRKGDMPILAIDHPMDLTIEAFRSLRTSLHFGMLDAQTPTLTITSTHPGAGKSFIAAHLAVVAAQAGYRVCLIDADLRRGQLRRYFGVPRNHPGLAEVLAGDLDPDAAVVAGSVEGLFFMGTGRYPPNPSEMLMRSELTRLIDWSAEKFDLVIFDAPPVLAVTDPVILGRSTGATLLVVRHDVNVPGEIDAAIRTFVSAGLRISGAVLNGFDPRKARGGYGYGYGYGYRYSYQQRKD